MREEIKRATGLARGGWCGRRACAGGANSLQQRVNRSVGGRLFRVRLLAGLDRPPRRLGLPATLRSARWLPVARPRNAALRVAFRLAAGLRTRTLCRGRG